MVKRVLLVENEKQIARFIDLELQKEGYQVDVVEDGKAGLALIAATKYDLILLITICQICLVKHSQRKSVGFAQLLF